MISSNSYFFFSPHPLPLPAGERGRVRGIEILLA